ncbi:MAG: F0F1 ATP synthase subunit delta [Candidatus Kaiserbacteria bacterium]|nr:F0F1 ATP synthase subunit delta [Candidatus Kaiserbacteria bacterium]
MEQTYATALWKLVENGMEYREAISALRENLAKTGRGNLLPRIGKAFERIAAREAAKNDVTLIIASEADEKKAHAAAKKALEAMNVDVKHLKTRIDPTIVGGWRLEGAGILVDESYKKSLLDMYNRAIQ